MGWTEIDFARHKFIGSKYSRFKYEILLFVGLFLDIRLTILKIS
jgi:hypothetical protein